MAWKSGFFNSVNGDRVYNAQDMSEMFKGLITDGIYESVGNKLAVQPSGGMVIQIATGRGFFNSHWVDNSTPYLTTLESADVTLNRYAAVCIRVDDSDSGRTAEPVIKYSDYATEPVKPTMERTDTVNEYCLAYIYINAGVTEITAGDIEDTRSNTDLCGWVTGLIEQLDTNTMYAQWEALFYEWFNGLQSLIDENVQTRLVSDVEQLKTDVSTLEGRALKSTGVFDGLGWDSQDDGTYIQTITVNGVTADNDILVSPSAEYKDTYIAMGCTAIAQDENSITFSCTDPDDIAMEVEVIIFNF